MNELLPQRGVQAQVPIRLKDVTQHNRKGALPFRIFKDHQANDTVGVVGDKSRQVVSHGNVLVAVTIAVQLNHSLVVILGDVGIVAALNILDGDFRLAQFLSHVSQAP